MLQCRLVLYALRFAKERKGAKMQPDSNKPRSYVGLKQSTEAVRLGLAQKAFIAIDADEHLSVPFLELCSQCGVPVEKVDTKAKLGKIFGINVPAAVAVELK